MNGRTYRRTYEWTDGRTYGRTNRRTDDVSTRCFRWTSVNTTPLPSPPLSSPLLPVRTFVNPKRTRTPDVPKRLPAPARHKTRQTRAISCSLQKLQIAAILRTARAGSPPAAAARQLAAAAMQAGNWPPSPGPRPPDGAGSLLNTLLHPSGRPSVHPFVRPSIRQSVRPSVRSFVPTHLSSKTGIGPRAPERARENITGSIDYEHAGRPGPSPSYGPAVGGSLQPFDLHPADKIISAAPPPPAPPRRHFHIYTNRFECRTSSSGRVTVNTPFRSHPPSVRPALSRRTHPLIPLQINRPFLLPSLPSLSGHVSPTSLSRLMMRC